MDFVNEYSNLVYFIYNRHFRSHAHLKDDLISEGFLSLCRAEKYFDESKVTKASAYVCKIIYFAMYKFVLKEEKHFNNLSLDDTYDEEENLSFIDNLAAPDLVDSYLTKESILKVFNTKLTPQMKQVVSLYFKDHYKQQVIADMMGTTQQTVSRIIKRFRRMCKEEDTEVIP